MSAPPILIAGGGPAGLAAAEVAAASGARVTVLEQMPSVGRKLLMAGRGGLNLTHAEPLERFLDRYGPERARLEPIIRAFPPDALRDWCAGLGIETFVGSSGRVFPVQMKASPLLRAWLRRLERRGVTIRTRTPWRDEPAATQVLAFGGASWPRLGSDGRWTAAFAPESRAPFAPANCGFVLDWSAPMRRFAGAPLKGCAFSHGGETLRGEAAVSGYGIEGGAIYALSRGLRETIQRDGAAVLRVDLKPDLSEAALADRLAAMRPGLSLSNRLRRLGLAPAAAALAREPGPPAAEPKAMAALLKSVPLTLTAPAPLDRAISSAGGLRWAALDGSLMLRARPGVFAAGEMIDWEAPTGGYLLTACIATGRWAGAAALRHARAQAGMGQG